MRKQNKLVNKVKRLIRRLGYPRWLNKYGPKKYEFHQHLTALLIRGFCRLSYRRVHQFLGLLGIACPSKSALQYTAARLDSNFWQKVMKITCSNPYIGAIDSTGFSRTNPSYHYLRRIDGKLPKVPVKLSVMFDTKKKKFSAARIRVLPSHDIKDIMGLLRQSKPAIIVADKAYDANWIHDLCSDTGIIAHIPLRRWGKPRFGNMSQRMKSAKTFRKKTYNRRVLVESGFGSIKRKFGSSVSSKKAKTIKSEIYGRLVCHNLFFWFKDYLGQNNPQNLYKPLLISKT